MVSELSGPISLLNDTHLLIMSITMFDGLQKAQVSDTDVPQFVDELSYGPAGPSGAREGASGVLRTFALRLEVALNRIAHATEPGATAPHAPFPNPEFIQHHPILARSWEMDVRPDCALGRVIMMLTEAPERAFPKEFVKHTASLKTLEDWRENALALRTIAYRVMATARREMFEARVRRPYFGGNDSWSTAPASYEVDPESIPGQIRYFRDVCESIEQRVLEKTLTDSDIALFLGFYNATLDPIAPLTVNAREQCEFFKELLQVSEDDILRSTSVRVPGAYAAQLAHEAIWLALPGIIDTQHTVFGDRHEQNYAWVNVFSLPRGEFARPERVMEICEEIIEHAKENGGVPEIVPITLGYYEAHGAKQLSPFVIDGNNRLTATAFLRLVAACEFRPECYTDFEVVDAFCKKKVIYAPKWENDLKNVAHHLKSNQKLMDLIEREKDIVRRVAASEEIPALIAHEPVFLTVDVSRSQGDGNLAFIQPFVQALVNGPGLPAIASKMQSHGRLASGYLWFPYGDDSVQLNPM